jgi:hypothetical protein
MPVVDTAALTKEKGHPSAEVKLLYPRRFLAQINSWRFSMTPNIKMPSVEAGLASIGCYVLLYGLG